MIEICARNPPPCSSANGDPYIASLANTYGIASQYLGVSHFSQADYIALLGGDIYGCVGYPCTPSSHANLVDRLEAAGLTWKGYMENQAVQSGCDANYNQPYTPEHNPFVFFTDITSNPARCSQVVLANPSGCSATDCSLINDLNSGSAPNFMWLTPDNCNNMHGYTGGCSASIPAGDTYLNSLVPNILNSQTFTTQRAALFVVFDEGNGYCPLNNSSEDCVYGVWAGSGTKTNFVSTNLYDHYSFTKTVEVNWNLASLASNDAAATPMTEFFTSTSPTPNFNLTPKPPALNVNIGGSNTSTIVVSSLNGFAGNVSLSSSISPAGSGSPSAFLSSNSVTLSPGGSASSILTVSSVNNTVAGSYNVTVSGASGGIAHSVLIPVQVALQKTFAVMVSSDGRVYKYYSDGTNVFIGKPVGTPLRQVAWKPDGSYALIVGDQGVMLTYDGTRLARLSSGMAGTTNLNTVAWRPDGSYALIAGANGLVFKYNSTGISRIADPSNNNIRSIGWNPLGNSALLMGDKGTALLYQVSGQITALSSGTGQPLFAVAWNPDSSYALASGGNGVILKYNGTSFKALSTTGISPAGKTVRFNSFDPAGSRALLVGDSGLVVTYDGSKLVSLKSGTSNALFSSSWSAGIAYIVGQQGTLLSYSGGTLTKLQSGTTSNLGSIAWKTGVTVSKRATSTAVACVPSTVVVGQSTSCAASVTDTSPGTAITPTGLVTFTPGGTCVLSGGSCSVSIMPTVAGTASVSGNYGGDSTHNTSTGGTAVTVNRRSTGTSISCSPNPVAVAQSTTCTATVTDSSPGTPSTPAGTVGFTSTGAGSFAGSPCNLVAGTNGTASCSVTYTPSGIAPRNDTITGVFTSAVSDSVHNGSQGMFPLSVGVVVVDPTGTNVSCSPGTVVVNQPTTCTATVTDTASAGATPPTGTVTFTPSGSCTLSNPSGASASCSVNITPTGTGSLSVSASYAGDATHGTSSGRTSVIVNNRATSLSMSCSPSQVAANDSTNCTATVTDTDLGTTNTPTGSVIFNSNSTGTFTPATSCSLVAGATAGVSSCQVTYTPSTAGHHLLNATYAGDNSHSVSSNSFNLGTTAQASNTTSTSISCLPSSLVLNQGTSCTATVTDTSGTPSTPTGLVTFRTNSTGTLTPATGCTLAASTTTGVAACSVTYTPSSTGHHGISGSYGGDSTHAASTTTTPFTLTVTPRITSTSIGCSPTSVVVNQATSCTATVSDTSPGNVITPTGSVSFTANATGTFTPATSCSLAASGTAGTARCSLTYTPGVTGHHLITGSYAGDSTHFGSSNSFNLPVGVSVHPTTTTVSCSASSVVVNQGTSCTATVTDPSATPTTPTGSVGFTTNSTGTFAPSGSCTLSASATVGLATCSVNYTPSTTGHHVITGTYPGDSGHTGSSGMTTLTVAPQPPPSQPYAVVVSHEGKVFRYQNGTFTLIGQPVTTPLRQVAWKPDGSYALIVGDSGVLLKYDGTQLTTIPTGITANLYTLAWKPDGSFALIGGSGGPLFRYDGVLTRLNNPFTNSIRSISWNPSGTQALMVGSSGGMLLYQSSTGQISQISSGTTAYLYSSAWNPNGLYALAAGEKGVILRYDGSSVTILNTAVLYNSTAIIHAISWNPSGTTALLVGDLGVVLTYDGNQLARVQSANSSDLYAISWLGSTAYIAGGTGTSLTYTGGVLSTLANNTGTSLRGWAWKPN